jgi:hypothetical protein
MVKGWRYLDDAGKIMNKWEGDFPEKSVGLEGLIMRNKNAVFETLKVNPMVIWMHFSFPERIDYVTNVSKSTIEGVSDILGVSQYKRIGLRLQYLRAIDEGKIELAVKQIAPNLYAPTWTNNSKILAISPFNFEFMLKVAKEPIEVNLRVRSARLQPEIADKKSLPKSGIILDLDLYRLGTTDIRDMGGIMKRVEDWVSTELSEIENRVFGGVDIG